MVALLASIGMQAKLSCIRQSYIFSLRWQLYVIPALQIHTEFAFASLRPSVARSNTSDGQTQLSDSARVTRQTDGE